MKRICTITHHTVPNYGAVLQTYALQKAIKKLGYSSEVLNYDEERVRRSYHYSLFSQRSLKDIVKHFVYFRYYKEKNAAFKCFLSKYVILSERYDRKKLVKANDKYDLFITGSDQVWSLALHQGDTAYLLGFVEDSAKKGSYAASFGHADMKMIPQIYYKTYKKLLSDFRFVYIREKQGIALYEQFTGKRNTAVQVLDPTFLIEPNEWETIENKPKYTDYILIYCVNRYNELMDFAVKLSQSTGKKILNIQDGQQVLPGVINIKNCSVETFIGLIHHADYVLTNSFHGIAFSIIFNRELIFDYVKSTVNSNSRVNSLVELLGLEMRELSSVNINNAIDYSALNAKLNEEKIKSYVYLRKMLDSE